MTFQAFDVALDTVILTQWNEVEKYVYHGVDYISPVNFTLAYLNIGQDNIAEAEIQLHVLVFVYQIIVLDFSPDILSQMIIHDGPGVLSPVIEPNPDVTRLSLSSYQAYIKYSISTGGNLITGYINANINKRSQLNMSTLTWTTYERQTENCQSYGTSIYLKGTNALCWQHHSAIIVIHHMTFTGVNMLRHSPTHTSLFATCQYGGLFVLTGSGTEYVKMCTNVSVRRILPFQVQLRDEGYGGASAVVVFITFPRYTSGFIELQLGWDRCFGPNMAISRGPSCKNHISHWDDQYYYSVPSTAYYAEVNLKEHCTDLWLVNDIDYFEPSPFEDCSFVLDHTQLAFPVGKFRMIISSAFISHSTVSTNSQSRAWPGSMNVAMDVFKDSQMQSTTTKLNFSVLLSELNENHFSPVAYTVFKLNLSVHDQFPVFAIRVTFLENITCAPETYSYGFTEFNKNRLYIINDSDQDLYLPRDHPYKHLVVYSMTTSGYNRGTCRMRIVGQACSSLESHYQIIRFHYLPHKSLVSPHEIDIAMKKTFNCSIKCSLDVGILEYMNVNETRRTRYHEWKGIYRLTWQVIAAKSRGFSVTINSTCETCETLCDVVVALGLPLTSNVILPKLNSTYAKYLDILETLNKKEYQLDYSLFENILSVVSKPRQGIASKNARYGSWHDAHAYCLTRNSSLFSLTPAFTGHLKTLVDSNDLDHGWRYPQEYFFVGLHRDSLVRIPKCSNTTIFPNTHQEYCLYLSDVFCILSKGKQNPVATTKHWQIAFLYCDGHYKHGVIK